MPRALRIEYPGAHYHVMVRGQRRDLIYRDDLDYWSWQHDFNNHFLGEILKSRFYFTTVTQQKDSMKMIPTRALAANSGLVMKQLDDEGVLVVTKDGRPRSIMLSTSEGTLMDDLRDCLYLRARKALKEAQMHSRSKGLDQLT